jgi:hypothetical protein
MIKRNRNIVTMFIMLQRRINSMANHVKTPIQNYFEKSVVWKFTDQIPACDICQQPRNMRVEWDNWVRDKRGFQHIGCVALYQLWFKVRFRINNPMERAAMRLSSRNLAKYSRCPWNILMMTIHFPTKYDYWTFVYNIFNRHYLLCVIGYILQSS